VIYNRDTKKSRGFGFVVFQSHEAVSKVLDEQNRAMHVVDGKQVEVKRCVARQESTASNKSGDSAKTGNGASSGVGGARGKGGRRQQGVIEEEKEHQLGADRNGTSGGRSGAASDDGNHWTRNPAIIAYGGGAQLGSSPHTPTHFHGSSPLSHSHDESAFRHLSQHQHHRQHPPSPAPGSHLHLHMANHGPQHSPLVGSPMDGRSSPFQFDHVAVMQMEHVSQLHRQQSTSAASLPAPMSRQSSASFHTARHHSFNGSMMCDDIYLDDPYGHTDDGFDEALTFRNERTASSSSSSSSTFFENFASPASPGPHAVAEPQHVQSPFHQSAFSPRSSHGEPQVPFMSLSSPVALEGRTSPSLPSISLDEFHQAAIGSPAVRASSPGPVVDSTGIWGTGLTSPSQASASAHAGFDHGPSTPGGGLELTLPGSPDHGAAAANAGANEPRLDIDTLAALTLDQSSSPLCSPAHSYSGQPAASRTPLRSPIKVSSRLGHHGQTGLHPLASPMSVASAPAGSFPGTNDSRRDFGMFPMNLGTTASFSRDHSHEPQYFQD